MTTVTDVRDLTKTFGDFRALTTSTSGLSRAPSTASSANGSGKSTTIRILLGVLHATSGTATVLGRIPAATLPY